MDVLLFALWIVATLYVLWACDWVGGKKADKETFPEKNKPVYREDINWNQWGR